MNGQDTTQDGTPPAKPRRKGHGKGGGISKRPGKASIDIPRMGRPPGLNAEVAKEIIESVVDLAMSEGRAALASGVTPAALSMWKTRGRLAFDVWDTLTPEQQDTERMYLEFFKALRDALPRWERSRLRIINDGSKTDWRAAKAQLEMHPKLRHVYGKRLMVAGDPDNKTPIPVKDTTEMSTEERVARARRVLDAHGK